MEVSDFFQNTKFCPSLNIYNSADDQCFKIWWVANLMPSCSMSQIPIVSYGFLNDSTEEYGKN